MHDDDLEHEHYYERTDSTELALAMGDLVRLLTVGIDVGSSTSHLMFSGLLLLRQGEALSSRYVVVQREVLHRSPVLLTPYTPDNAIDARKLGEFVREAYREAGIDPGEVDSGAIILTGEALKRENARAIAEGLAGESGRFVCATAGHNLEAVLSAHGSGAVAQSYQQQQTFLNVDIGGGTTKLALVRNGEILGTAAVNVGGRLVALDGSGRLIRIEPAARRVAEDLGLELELGAGVPDDALERISARLAEVLLEVVRLSLAGHAHLHHHAGHEAHEHGPALSPLTHELMLTPALHAHGDVDALTFSGGVSEYLYEREQRDFGDLGRPLALAVRRCLASQPALPPIQASGERIRATAIGASQFTVQVSGNTIAVSQQEVLPLHNLPVIHPRLAAAELVQSEVVAKAIRRAHQRLDLEPGAQPVALALDWSGTPWHQSLHNLAQGIVQGLEASLRAGHPLVLVFNADLGKTIGRILREELGVGSDLISIDSVELQEFDYVDIGQVLQPAQAVPVVVKSLVFPALSAQHGEILETGLAETA